MPPLTATWAHGNSLVLENTGAPGATTTPRGWGMEVRFPAANNSAWLHVPIPTPVLMSDQRAKVFRFFVLFGCDPNLGFIDAVHFYDGFNKVQEFNGLHLGGSAFINQIVNSTPGGGHGNAFVLTQPHTVLWGLGISFHFRTVAPSALLTVSTAGCDLNF